MMEGVITESPLGPDKGNLGIFSYSPSYFRIMKSPMAGKKKKKRPKEVLESYTRSMVVDQRTTPLVSNSSQSPVPVGSKPIDRHFHKPTPRVRILQSRKTNFCNGSVNIDFGSLTVEGAN